MNSQLFKALACISTTLALCLQSSSVEAVFADVKAIGMGGACISYPLDTLSAAYNPAGMGVVGDRLDVEAGWVHNTGSIDNSNNLIPVPVPGTTTTVLAPIMNGHYEGMRTKDIFPANFGINKAFCWCDWQFSAGLIVYNRSYQKTTIGRPLVLFGTSKPGLEFLNETVSPTFTATWNCRHTLGISANFQVERLKVNGIENFDNALFSAFPGHVTNRGYAYSTGWGVTIGYLGQITDELSIGLTYQPRTHMSNMKKYKGFLANHRIDVPAKISGGISYRILPCLVAAFDVEFLQWTKVKSLANKLLHDGSLELLGTSHGPGFGFDNQTFYRFGIEWQANDQWAFRTGFRYANTPVKESQAIVNGLTIDLVERFWTAGATYNINDCNEVSLAFAYGFEHSLRGPIPAIFGGGTIKLKEQKYALGLAWGYKY